MMRRNQPDRQHIKTMKDQNMQKSLRSVIYPFCVSSLALAAPVSAQDVPLTAISTPDTTTQVASNAAVPLSLSVDIAVTGTYVILVPANSGLAVRLDNADLVAAPTAEEAGPGRAITTLDAGTHVFEITGADAQSLSRVNEISLNRLGLPVQRLSSFATAPSVVVDTPVTTLSGRAAARTATVQGTRAADDIDRLLADAEAVSNGDPISRTPDMTAPTGDAGLTSPLSPPQRVALTQAVELIGQTPQGGVVASTGQTLFGGVMDPATYDAIDVVIAPSGRTTRVDVGAIRGQFAVRLFAEDLTTGAATVSVQGVSTSDDTITTQPVSYAFTARSRTDGVTEVLSRITYGPTPELYARVRAVGATAYIEEQLNPDRIRDTAFKTLRVDDYFSSLRFNRFFELADAEMAHRMAYAAYSEKQLQEVMGDFWSNHFFATTKKIRNGMQNIHDRAFFRENAFGNFEDLLLYSARSPLMSAFLDNYLSRYCGRFNPLGCVNENYAREILELHTVGADAGYGADDILAVARVFTGWGFRNTNEDEAPALNTPYEYEFSFRGNPIASADIEIPFLDTTIRGRAGQAGVEGGEELIAILADHPRTRAYVCGKIVQRFVADVPPANFIDICTATWLATDGNSGEILRAILLAPEFLEGAANRGTKVKTPYEYSISIIRALGAEIDETSAQPDGRFLTHPRFFTRFRDASIDAGYDPLRFGVPTGLPEVGTAWIGSGSMLGAYRQITGVVQNPNEYGIDLAEMTADARLETAEEVAAFLLTIATADVYPRGEYEALIGVLKGVDGIFEPLISDETAAFQKAGGLLVMLPSFLIQ